MIMESKGVTVRKSCEVRVEDKQASSEMWSLHQMGKLRPQEAFSVIQSYRAHLTAAPV